MNAPNLRTLVAERPDCVVSPFVAGARTTVDERELDKLRRFRALEAAGVVESVAEFDWFEAQLARRRKARETPPEAFPFEHVYAAWMDAHPRAAQALLGVLLAACGFMIAAAVLPR